MNHLDRDVSKRSVIVGPAFEKYLAYGINEKKDDTFAKAVLVRVWFHVHGRSALTVLELSAACPCPEKSRERRHVTPDPMRLQ